VEGAKAKKEKEEDKGIMGTTERVKRGTRMWSFVRLGMDFTTRLQKIYFGVEPRRGTVPGGKGTGE